LTSTQLAAHPADFDPARISKGIYTSRRTLTHADVASALVVMLIMLYLIPAREVVPGLTGNGRPATLVAMALFGWWLLARLSPRTLWVGPQPMRWAMWFWLLSLLCSYWMGLHRGLLPLEANGQDLAVISTLQMIGVVVATADGISNWSRLRTVLKAMVWCAAFMAVIGIGQWLTKQDVSRYLVLPGLQLHGDLIGLEQRGTGFYRVNGTAYHYIEFSACLATVLPFGIHFAKWAPQRKMRRWYLILSMIIAVGIPIALSRTGIVALAIVLVVMVPAWGKRMSANILALGSVLVAGFIVARPGELGTLTSLFFVSPDDPSIGHRIAQWNAVGQFFSERPWFGRGPGTLIPQVYNGLILDDEWLYSLVTLGLVGVAALALIHVIALVLAFVSLLRSRTAEDRQLCAALMAAVLVSVVVAGTFDSLGFTSFAFTIAILWGMCGTVWRFTHPARSVRTSTKSPEPLSTLDAPALAGSVS
jgi:O-antigen ligase